MPRNIVSALRTVNLESETTSSSASDSGSEGPIQENLRHFNAIDMVKAVDTNMWPSSEDEEISSDRLVRSVNKRINPRKSIDERSDGDQRSDGGLGDSMSKVKEEVRSISILVDDPDPSKSVAASSIKALTPGGIDGVKNLMLPETVSDCEPKELPPRGRRRSSVFGLLQFSLGKKEVKTKTLTLDEQISELEKRIAKKMKKLGEMQLQLQELKNLNTN